MSSIVSAPPNPLRHAPQLTREHIERGEAPHRTVSMPAGPPPDPPPTQPDTSTFRGRIQVLVDRGLTGQSFNAALTLLIELNERLERAERLLAAAPELAQRAEIAEARAELSAT